MLSIIAHKNMQLYDLKHVVWTICDPPKIKVNKWTRFSSLWQQSGRLESVNRLTVHWIPKYHHSSWCYIILIVSNYSWMSYTMDRVSIFWGEIWPVGDSKTESQLPYSSMILFGKLLTIATKLGGPFHSLTRWHIWKIRGAWSFSQQTFPVLHVP